MVVAVVSLNQFLNLKNKQNNEKQSICKVQ